MRLENYKKSLFRKIKYIKGSIQGNSVNVYWFDKLCNFGDLLNPVVFKYYGMTPIRTSRRSADVIAVGSNLDDTPENFSGYIIGSGQKFNVKRSFPDARILALRGKLTRDNIGAKKNTPLGDPGLLVSCIYPKRLKKNYLLGLIPHYVDKEDERLHRIFQQNNKDVLIIDVQRKPKKVISEIDQCEFILSSSLHGLIAAESLGIPSGWIYLSGRVAGDGFKFYDYASAIGLEIAPNIITGSESLSQLTKMTNRCSKNLNDVRQNLDHIFRKFTQIFFSN